MTARTRITSILTSVVLGATLGAVVGFYATIAPALMVGAVTVTRIPDATVEPTDEMVGIMTVLGRAHGAPLVNTECYAARPATACIAVYATPRGPVEVPWIFIATVDGLRAY